jgi:hypothetical protein
VPRVTLGPARQFEEQHDGRLAASSESTRRRSSTERLQKLVTFDDSEEFKQLPAKTKELLWRQVIVMSEYSALLDLRIREFAS